MWHYLEFDPGLKKLLAGLEVCTSIPEKNIDIYNMSRSKCGPTPGRG